MRYYEMFVVADPRISDEEMVGLVDAVKELLAEGGGELAKEESWGKRRLAYPIEKLNEGRYHLLYLQTDGLANPFPVVEQRLRQNDKVLRFMTVRTEHPAPVDEPVVVEGVE